jgi:major inositol transporter-like SP family MFS transporter
LTSTISKATSKVTLKEAFCTDERYKKASWINVADITFHELTGINSILIFSNTILATITDGGLSPRVGTAIIGFVNFASAASAFLVLQRIGRRPLLIWGHTGIAIAHFAIGVMTILAFDWGILVGICVFIIIYELTSGPVAWMYAAETCCDMSLGICMYTLYFVVFILSLVTEPLMNSKMQP